MTSSNRVILASSFGAALVFGGIAAEWKPIHRGWTKFNSHFALRASFPSNQVAAALKRMCSKEYQMTVETRREGNVLQVFFWRFRLLKGDGMEMRRDAAEALERVLLCATRVALSTDAPLQFVEVKMEDALTGATVTLWRYVPDIRDSMYARMGEDEYINRLVLEVNTDGHRELSGRTPRWDVPLTMSEFLAKQVVLRTKRQSPLGLLVHEDLSQPSTLVVVIDNWQSIEEQGTQQKSKIPDFVEKISKDVLHAYRFHGFEGVILQDDRGAALRSWKL